MKVKAVIFDLDGTLFNSIADIAASCNKMLMNHGFERHPEEDYLKWIGNGAYKLVERALNGKLLDPDQEIINRYLKEYNEIYLNNCTVYSQIYDGIPRVLDFLTAKGISMNINTNKPQDITEKVVQHYFSKWKFDFVIGQQTAGVKKPDPQAALYIAEKLGLSPADMLFIGDSDVDAQTGKNAGMNTIGVAWGYRKIDENTGFNLIVSAPGELISVLEKMI
jgi:phosphoglycolate phosphatase